MARVVVVSLENVDRIRGSIKVLEKEEDLWKWLAHTKKMVAKVRGLGEDSDLLETLIGGKIISLLWKQINPGLTSDILLKQLTLL